LQRVEQGVCGETVDAGVEEGVLYLHEGDHDGLGAFEDGEVDAGVFIRSDRASEADAASFATIPLVVEVAEGLMAEGGGAAFGAVHFDVGAGTDVSHGMSPVLRRKKTTKTRRHEVFGGNGTLLQGRF
jgi:hypothetical protein